MLHRLIEGRPADRVALVIAAMMGATSMVSGCATPADLPAGPDAYRIFPGITETTTVDEYKIGPSDAISVVIFNEPDISSPQLRVDIGGNVNLPLIGKIQATGKTTDMLAREIEQRMAGGGFLVNPKATVNLVEAVSQKVTVEGQVTQPGVYQITGQTTLLEALALSHGETRIAKLNEVAIFRIVDGKQAAAKFDIKAIRRGEAPNPLIQGNDIVIVGFNGLASAWRDFLQAAPAFAIFSRPFY